MVIVEYCKYGNLSNYLKSKRNFFCASKVRRQVPWVGLITPGMSGMEMSVLCYSPQPLQRRELLWGDTIHLICFKCLVWDMSCQERAHCSPDCARSLL